LPSLVAVSPGVPLAAPSAPVASAALPLGELVARCRPLPFSLLVSVSGLPAGLSAAEAAGVARPRREAAAVEVGDALAVLVGEAEAAGLIAGVALIAGEPPIAGEAAAVAPGEA
jgi:hypothetical protein